jgi:hypothetical protein
MAPLIEPWLDRPRQFRNVIRSLFRTRDTGSRAKGRFDHLIADSSTSCAAGLIVVAWAKVAPSSPVSASSECDWIRHGFRVLHDNA